MITGVSINSFSHSERSGYRQSQHRVFILFLCAGPRKPVPNGLGVVKVNMTIVYLFFYIMLVRESLCQKILRKLGFLAICLG